MNERILDICIKAGINTWPFNEVGFISLDESELEKFAELIVRECAGVAEGLSKLYPEKVGFDVGYTMGTARTAKDIKERFGVEE